MPTTTYAHFRDVPESAWRWPSFSPAEIACRGTGAIKINTEAADRPLRLSQPQPQPRGWRGPCFKTHAGHGV